MKTTNERIFLARNILGGLVGKGNIRTNYATNKNLSAILDLLKPLEKTLKEDESVQAYLKMKKEDEPTEQTKAGKELYEQLLKAEIEFEPHKYNAAWMTGDFKREGMSEEEEKQAQAMNQNFAVFLSEFDAFEE